MDSYLTIAAKLTHRDKREAVTFFYNWSNFRCEFISNLIGKRANSKCEMLLAPVFQIAKNDPHHQ